MLDFFGANCLFGPPHANGLGAAQNITINSANLTGWSFFTHAVKTVSKIHFYIASVTGTPAAGDFQVDIYSDNDIAGSNAPNASLGLTTTRSGSSAGTWVNWSAGTLGVALTAHTQYWVVVRNLNGTPASNYFVFRQGNNGGNFAAGVQVDCYFGWHRRTFTSNWFGGTNVNVMPGMVIEYSDGSYQGFPFQDATNNDTDRVYGGRELGTYFTSPATKLIVSGFLLHILKQGSPTGTVQAKLYEGTTLVATSGSIPATHISTTATPTPFLLASPYTLKASTVYRLVISNSATDSSSNYYGMPSISLDTTSTWAGLRPMAGRWYKTYNNSGWVETVSTYTPATLILDSSSSDLVSPSYTDPGVTNVRSGVSYDFNDATNNGLLTGSVIVNAP